MASRIKLLIGGIEYLVNADEDEEYLRKIGDKLNKAMDDIKTRSPYLSTTMVAVLAALQYCDEAEKASADADRLRAQLKKYIEETAGTNSELEELRRDNERLRRDVELLIKAKK